ncbi:LOW QUALITY PROTEIN: hypothetical protein U9M48_026628, partial [Paspalum notatum var. saurae]
MPELRLRNRSRHTLFCSSYSSFFFCHVDMASSVIRDSSRGSHPPWGTLARHADRYVSSMEPNPTVKSAASTTFRFHTVVMTRNIRHVVANITKITASPGIAFPIISVSRNPTVTARHKNMRTQFTS